jgi:hypothetical protein
MDDEQTHGSNFTETTKRASRDALNSMETDLSASIMVMPLENGVEKDDDQVLAGLFLIMC